MDGQDWIDLASVYRAGSLKSRQWIMNVDRQQEAEVLAAMADRCEEIGVARGGTLPDPYEGGQVVGHTNNCEIVENPRGLFYARCHARNCTYITGLTPAKGVAELWARNHDEDREDDGRAN